MLGGMILIAGSIIMIQNNIKDTDPRGDYEKFLTDQMEVLKGIDTETVQEMPKMDRPDLAGIQEYLRTVDPELKAVPNWRTIDAHNQLKQAQVNFKSGQEQLDWTHHTTNMGGRTRAIMYDPNDATNSKVWAGSVTGGLWYTPDA